MIIKFLFFIKTKLIKLTYNFYQLYNYLLIYNDDQNLNNIFLTINIKKKKIFN